jgi:hypothetical protein
VNIRTALFVAEAFASSYDSDVTIGATLGLADRRWAWLTSFATVLFLWQLRHPVIRFSVPLLDFVVGTILAFGLPWSTACLIWRAARRRSTRVVLVVCVIVLLLPYSLAVLLGSAMTALAFKGGDDMSFRRVAELPWNGTFVRLYLTDGGATTDYGIVVRHERAIAPGVVLVRNLDDFYHCASLDLEGTRDGVRLKDERSYCSGFSAANRDCRLKRFVYL